MGADVRGNKGRSVRRTKVHRLLFKGLICTYLTTTQATSRANTPRNWSSPAKLLIQQREQKKWNPIQPKHAKEGRSPREVLG